MLLVLMDWNSSPRSYSIGISDGGGGGGGGGGSDTPPLSNDEVPELIKWINQALTAKGQGGHLVTDLASDMVDGITLLKLVEAIADEPLPSYAPAPIMRAQKFNNLQICLQQMGEWHVPLDKIQADDLLSENMSAILTVCKTLKKHFTSGRGGGKGQRSRVYTAIDKEDVAVFTWVGQICRREINSYSTFYDGLLLCQLMNLLHEGAISNEELEAAKDPLSRLRLAESAAEKYLFISSSFHPAQVGGGGQDGRLRAFLHQCKLIYQQRTRRRGMMATSSSLQPSNEGVSSVGGAREAREAAHINARSYEALQKRKSEEVSEHYPTPTPTPTPTSTSTSTSSRNKRHSDLYIQGASSFTDLSSRRAEHQSMVRGGGAGGGGARGKLSTKTSSSDNLDQNVRVYPFVGGLDRVHSMESGISSQDHHHHHHHHRYQHGQGHRAWSSGQATSAGADNTLPRSSSQGTLLHGPHPPAPPAPSSALSNNKTLTRSTESFNFSVGRVPSYLHLSSTTSEDIPHHVTALEERVAMLATQFLYERQDIFKQIMRALVKERKKRRLLEHRVEALEKASKEIVKHYDSRLIDLAKELAVVRTEVAMQTGEGATSSSITMEMEQLREQLSTLTASQKLREQELQLPETSLASSQTLFLRKRKVLDPSSRAAAATAGSGGGVGGDMSEDRGDLLESFSQGSAASYKKLSRFFGEAPPRVENLESLLEDLGYMHLLKKFQAHGITLAELVILSEGHLETIGVSLGERVRLLEAARKLEPVEYGNSRHKAARK